MSFSSVKGETQARSQLRIARVPALGQVVSPTGKLKPPGVLCHGMLPTVPFTANPTGL